MATLGAWYKNKPWVAFGEWLPTSMSCWYEEGLRFACTQCGDCCVVEGFVWVDQEEVQRLAAYLGLDVDTFSKRYLRQIGSRRSLVEKATGECVFWDGRCEVYPARPNQCRSFPFWTENLATPSSWRTVETECPGAGQGRLYSREEMERIAKGKGAASEEAAPENVLESSSPNEG